MSKLLVTTSWDDGDNCDLKVAELLDKYNLKGTFYVPKGIDQEITPGKKPKRLSDEELKTIAKKFEIGAHSLKHVFFDELNREEIKDEIFGSKAYLENLLNKKIEVFCYPGGISDSFVVQTVKDAEFIGARTCEEFSFEIKDPFLMGTTIHCYPFPFRKDVLGKLFFFPIRKNYGDIRKYKLPFNSFFGWTHLAKNLFDYARKSGGVFHLWGHSWEVEKYGMWNELEEVFKYISGRQDVEYLVNSEVIISYKD